MTGKTRAKLSSGGAPSPAWEDQALVDHCLQGDERAWEALIEKYKRLIYSIPFRYGLPPDDSAEVFQAVCVDLFTGLETLRNVGALRGWLARVAANKCFHWKRDRSRVRAGDLSELGPDSASGPSVEPDWVDRLEREQVVREAIERLTPKCREMIRLLFFEDPPRPYEEVAKTLGLATGSIGFTRGWCLKKLARALEELGL
jgi:RNA polymerase sigma factor (sigma-70 family)